MMGTDSSSRTSSISSQSSSAASVPAGVLSTVISRNLRIGLLSLVAEILLVLGDGLLVLLHGLGEGVDVAGPVALLQHIDEAFHGLDGLLRLAQLSVQLRQLGAGIGVVGARLNDLAQGLRGLARKALTGEQVSKQDARPGVFRGRGEVALELTLSLLVLAGLGPKEGEVQAEVLVGNPGRFELLEAVQGPRLLA